MQKNRIVIEIICSYGKKIFKNVKCDYLLVGAWPSGFRIMFSIPKIRGSKPARGTFGKWLKTIFHGSTQAM